ncbi:amidohydrolase [Kribbella capetownensis]|uniref:Amidohydrolase n=1 Tax=Kribbella capetownensis TaxID=1572659 RepID=A0A4R0JKA1_9ACTN|nr:amidohydrolase family protein [Kribbella capetownensis]TCC45168.1 amidohydrolase [Kribbella capetownensis]
MSLADHIADLSLVDHHVHGAFKGRLDRTAFEQLITESDRPVPPWLSTFDSQLGLAIRRYCAPLLGLQPHASPDDYLAARAQQDPNTLLLNAAGVSDYLVDTGYQADAVTGVDELAALSGSRAHEVVRLESELEYVAAHESTVAAVPHALLQRLEERTAGAVGLKSIVAYRHGFDFDPAEPSTREVLAALDRWYSAGADRVTDPVLLRWLLWIGARRGLPLQLHVGFGDTDLNLRTADPLLLTEWLRQVEPLGTQVALLHCYPFHREVGYLAHVFPHVYFDLGLTTMYVGARAAAVIAEGLELAPFGKLLYSSDAFGPAELHYLGAVLWRRAVTSVLGGFVEQDDWSAEDAVRVATLWGRDNARRLYRLPS